MLEMYEAVINKIFKTNPVFIFVLFSLLLINRADCKQKPPEEQYLPKLPSQSLEVDLKDIPYKIVYETFRETDGKENWELYMMNADGSDKVNLTKTPDLDEMYPHASPDGTKLCFVVDEGTNRRNKTRSVYYMNIDGSNRRLVARDARQPCWSPDGKKIVYLLPEYDTYSTREYATSELMIYSLDTGRHEQHPNTTLRHVYALCWSPDGNWFMGVVQGHSEYSDTILVIEAEGTGVYDLEKWGVKGCRPDIRYDGKKITWGETDWDLCLGDIDFNASEPRVDNVHKIVRCYETAKIYHVDFSPDGKYIAFSYGPSAGGQQVGGKAKGWNICVTDLSGKWVKITTDGNHNKEPDWIPLSKTALVREIPPESATSLTAEESRKQDNLAAK
ncbi:MAG: PD40 domain-containing protein [Sedimentisphaerales bacterium]|nr:PD40 domain-containing protein [Sedimentisphaerales bacterium]